MARYEVHQTDGNAKRLYAYAEALGMSVAILNRPVDAAVGFQGITALVEVKRPGEKLRPNQKAFLDGWRGLWDVWFSEGDVSALRSRMALLGASKRLETPISKAHEQAAARFERMFVKASLTDSEKLPDPDYGL